MATQNPQPGTNEQDPNSSEISGSGENVTPTPDSDITPAELELLDKAGINESEDDDDTLLDEARIDDTDEDGDPLNEQDDLTGGDLDVPGSDTDDDDELIGEEDEENNSYSNSDQDDEEDETDTGS